MSSNNVSVGSAGEYFVAAELERHGFTVALPMSNVKDFDILAIDRQTYKQYAIQVKTTRHKSKRWILSKKNENIEAENIIYFFVCLNEMDAPEYHIVPSTIVAKTLKSMYKIWLNTPGKNGKKHNDNPVRNFWDNDDKYLDKWDYLGK